jgi:O-acetylhomoserine (thiol)-lyase
VTLPFPSFCKTQSFLAADLVSLFVVPSGLSPLQQIPEAERLRLGITPDLIRMSVGIEDVDDLIRDIDQALKVAVGGK